ncbi:MAG: hypothetical protein ACJ78W_16705, partial [Myxococcales bacterium]
LLRRLQTAPDVLNESHGEAPAGRRPRSAAQIQYRSKVAHWCVPLKTSYKSLKRQIFQLARASW